MDSKQESEADKLKKRQDKERRREAEAVKKRLIKTLTKERKPKDKESKDPLENKKDPEALKKPKTQDPTKKDDKQSKKLKEASDARRSALKQKSKRPVGEKERSANKVTQDEKKARLTAHLKEKAASRASMDKQKASLEAEVKALNRLSEVKETIDGQYTARFSGFESAIAAGPMGATSTGLRKLDPSVWINMKRADVGAKIQNKIDPHVQKQLAKITKVARDLKSSNLKEFKWAQSVKVKAMKETLVADQKIEHSKLRSKIKEMKVREKMRDPNREPSKFDELNMPFRGVGGTGGV